MDWGLSRTLLLFSAGEMAPSNLGGVPTPGIPRGSRGVAARAVLVVHAGALEPKRGCWLGPRESGQGASGGAIPACGTISEHTTPFSKRWEAPAVPPKGAKEPPFLLASSRQAEVRPGWKGALEAEGASGWSPRAGAAPEGPVRPLWCAGSFSTLLGEAAKGVWSWRTMDGKMAPHSLRGLPPGRVGPAQIQISLSQMTPQQSHTSSLRWPSRVSSGACG